MYLGDDEQSSPKYLLPIVGFIEIFLWIKVKNLQVIDFYVAFQIIGKYLLFINCLLSIT